LTISTSGGYGMTATCGAKLRHIVTTSRPTPATSAAASVQAAAGESSSLLPAAATSPGDGVSPASSAASSGSPPGSAAPISPAVAGLMAGSRSRQRRITFSVTVSSPSTRLDGAAGAELW
jgi:hypothetical protein